MIRTGASSVVAGCLHAYAIVGGAVQAWGLGAQGADGTAWAWGYGLQGNLGDGQDASSSVPVQITGISSPVSSVTPWDPGGYARGPTEPFGGVASIMARGTDGSLWSWGYSGFGASGSGGKGANPGRVPRVPAVSAVFPASARSGSPQSAKPGQWPFVRAGRCWSAPKMMSWGSADSGRHR